MDSAALNKAAIALFIGGRKCIIPCIKVSPSLCSWARDTYPSAGAEAEPAEQHRRSPLQDKAPFRLWRAFNASPCMDGVEALKERLTHLPQPLRSPTVRLDHALADLPRLDEVARAAELADEAYTVPDQLVRTNLDTCFFF
ncbi:hypothetical protein ABHI18_007556 [Aspergillus niger]